MLTTFARLTRTLTAAAALAATGALGACSNAGQLGDILGGVLGGTQNGTEVAGTIRGVDANNRQITLQQSNGQNVALGFDQNTRVIYQSRAYAVTNLEYGDQVVARVQNNNGNYYTDSITVTQPVNGNGTSTTGNVQAFAGTVRTLDRQNGVFTLDVSNSATLTVSLPYNVGSADLQRFQNLRSGDYVRFSGAYLNNSRVELRQFQ